MQKSYERSLGEMSVARGLAEGLVPPHARHSAAAPSSSIAFRPVLWTCFLTGDQEALPQASTTWSKGLSLNGVLETVPAPSQAGVIYQAGIFFLYFTRFAIHMGWHLLLSSLGPLLSTGRSTCFISGPSPSCLPLCLLHCVSPSDPNSILAGHNKTCNSPSSGL